MALRDLFTNIFHQRKEERGGLPEYTYFDHLYSEYLALKPSITDDQANALFNDIHTCREKLNLTWNDIYAFELNLLKFLPLENLRRKDLSLRTKFLSVAGQKRYDDYIDSEPPKLETETDPEKLRADIRYLLDELYLIYASVVSREGLRKWLTVRAGGATLALLLIVILLFIFSAQGTSFGGFSLPGLPILVVLFAGAMGGFVSMLQRLQSAPNEGDPIYNLSVFWYGAYAIFLAPLTGAIFAILLYLMFTGSILKGLFFPNIYTPRASVVVTAAPTPSPTASPSPTVSPPPVAVGSPVSSPTVSPTATPVATVSPTPAASPSPTATASGRASPTPTASPPTTASPSPGVSPTPPRDSLSFRDFLRESGPVGGTDYALLIIWCFIAGFAERFVPDSLNRLVDNKEAEDKKKL